MKEENYIYISDQESYPSLDTLNRYISGDLPEEEKIRVEKIIENDPFLADVLEGLNETGDVEMVKMAVGRIKSHSQKRLFTKTKKRENLTKRQSRVAPHKYTQLIMATAAAIAFLIASVFIVNQLGFKDPKNPQIAENTEELNTEGNLDKTIMSEPEPQIIPPLDSVENENSQENESLFAEAKPVVKEADQILRKNTTLTETREESEEEKEEAVVVISKDVPQPTDTHTAKPTVDPKKPKKENQAEDNSMDLDDDLAMAKNRENIAQQERAKMQVEKKSLSLMKAEEAEAKNDKAEYMSEKEVNNIPLRQEGPVLIPLDGRLSPKSKKKYKDRTDYLAPENAPPLTDEQIMMGKYQKSVALAEMMTEADRLYKEGSYQAALNNVYEILRADPENVMANYYAGGCYFAMQEYKTATPFLKTVVKTSDSKFTNNARWLLAQAYLKRNKFRNAESELKILVGEKTPYADQAAELIEKLNR